MKLINAEELIEFLKKEKVECDELYERDSEHTVLGWGEEAEFISEKVAEMPDAVVRCKDCKYWIPFCEFEGKQVGDCYGTDIEMTEDDFCSRGERKDG